MAKASQLARDGVIRWIVWLESSRKQVSAFRREDNGDRSEWSIYNQGRADALEAANSDVARLLSNAAGELRPPAAQLKGTDGKQH